MGALSLVRLQELAARLERELRKESALRTAGVRVKVGDRERDELAIYTRGLPRYFVCGRTMVGDVTATLSVAREVVAYEERIQAACGRRATG